MKYIPISGNPKILSISGFIFAELSEDIINDYINVGIYIGLSVSEYYLRNPYRNDNKKVIVLIGINKQELKKQDIKEVNKLGLPLINTSGNYYSIPVVHKINNKNIPTLEHMEKLLVELDELAIRLKIHNSNGIRLTFKNKIIQLIKLDD
jgi:hypothetical protein